MVHSTPSHASDEYKQALSIGSLCPERLSDRRACASAGVGVGVPCHVFKYLDPRLVSQETILLSKIFRKHPWTKVSALFFVGLHGISQSPGLSYQRMSGQVTCAK
jgi:hypothetical protein